MKTLNKEAEYEEVKRLGALLDGTTARRGGNNVSM
jgi:hypothetical protein